MKKITVFLMMVFVIVSMTYSKDVKRYEEKSGEIEYKVKTITNGKASEMKIVAYFDNYGIKTASRMISDTQILTGENKKSDITNIMIENKTYMLNNIEKNYIVMEDEEEEENEEDDNENEENYKKIGKEKIAGKECDILYFEEKSEEGIMTEKMWMWKGIPLKTESISDYGAFKTKSISEAVKVDMKSISKSVFEIPKGYKENVETSQGLKAFDDAMKKYEEEMKKYNQ